MDTSILIDILVWIILAIFIYRGQKWAIIGAIILWTPEKGSQSYGIVESGDGSAVAMIIWWATYVDIFWKAYLVEREKNREIMSNKAG